MIVQIEPFANPDHLKCSHPRCDGRDAKWILPQSVSRPAGPYRSCSVHLARIAEWVLVEYLGAPEIPYGERPKG